MVFEWRNHPQIRNYMFSQQHIAFEEHCIWFDRANKNSDINLMIFEHGSLSLGFVNFSRTRCYDVAEWGFYLAPNLSRGYGADFGRVTLQFAFEELNLHKLSGQALAFNERSINFHKKLGFKEEGILREHHKISNKFYDVFRFGLLKNDWQHN